MPSLTSYNVGSSPSEELSDSTSEFMDESGAYQRQLCRVFGDPPGDAHFAMDTTGSYNFLMILFDPEVPAEADYALAVSDGVAKWDAEAMAELGINS